MINTTTLSGELRRKILGLYHGANAGHIGCSLSCIDLMIASLVQRKREQDTFLLSKGHAAAALYVCLNHLGEISDEQLDTFYKNGTTLPAHPAPNQHRGIPFATGSLGHGLPIGTGIAQAGKLIGDDSLAFVLMSDGETNEGTTWEAAHFAVQNRLDNLIVLIDKNGLQGFGNTADVMGDTASANLWRAIGFEVVEVNGHDIAEIGATIDRLTATPNRDARPKVIIAHTVKGKGVSYMENKLEWHYLPMTPAQYDEAMGDVNEKYGLLAPSYQ
jgi:transketolase